jgi:hypothetical protein
MMLKVLPLTALALGLSSGAAFADRHGGDRRGNEHHGSSTVVVRDHGGRSNVVVHDRGRGNVVVRENNGWRGGGRVVVRNEPRYSRGSYYHGGYGYRRPIYVSRPIISGRYYNYYRRPAVIVENYNPMAGYYWVAGAWTWSGAEWIWQPGHYEPDPNFSGSYYDSY